MFKPSLQFYTVGIVVTNISIMMYMYFNNFLWREILTIGFFYFMGIALTDVRAKAIGMLMATHNHKLREWLRRKDQMEDISNKKTPNIKGVSWAKDGSNKINIKDYEGDKKVYWPHIGVTEWDEMFYQNMQWKTYLKDRIIEVIWQGPWKLQYHGPMSMVFFDEWGFEDITFGGIRKKDIMMIIGKKTLTDNPTTKIKDELPK